MKKKNIVIIVILVFITLASFMFAIVKIIYPDIRQDNISLNELSNELDNYLCEIETINSDDNIVSHYKTDDSCIFNIEYIIFKNDTTKKEYFSKFLKEVNNNGKITGSYTTNITMGMLLVGKDTYGDKYKSVMLKNNSIMFLDTSIEKMKEAEELRVKLGYYDDLNIENFKYMIIPFITFSIGTVYVIYFVIKYKKNKLRG